MQGRAVQVGDQPDPLFFDMELDGNAIDLGLDDHIYFSKEASSGGRGFGGGGCGCN